MDYHALLSSKTYPKPYSTFCFAYLVTSIMCITIDQNKKKTHAFT